MGEFDRPQVTIPILPISCFGWISIDTNPDQGRWDTSKDRLTVAVC